MVVFLCETKANEVGIKKVANLIGFSNFCAIGLRGRVGGICMLWSNEVDIEVLEFNSHMIAITIKDCAVSWSLVGFYGPPQKTKRDKTWVDLHALLQSIPGPWMCCEDFNVVINDEEKVGGITGGPSTPSLLKELLFDLAAVDLGYVGNRFTWSNRRWGRNSIRERLDRVLQILIGD